MCPFDAYGTYHNDPGLVEALRRLELENAQLKAENAELRDVVSQQRKATA